MALVFYKFVLILTETHICSSISPCLIHSILYIWYQLLWSIVIVLYNYILIQHESPGKRTVMSDVKLNQITFRLIQET